jgi:hypothetical protein
MRQNTMTSSTSWIWMRSLFLHHMQLTEFANDGAGTGGGFNNTKELQVMNFNEAVNGPDGEHWKAEVENGYQQMLANEMFEVVLKKDLTTGICK